MQNRTEEADAHLKRALIIKERAFGPEHPRVAETLAVVGVLHASRNEYASRARGRTTTWLRPTSGRW